MLLQNRFLNGLGRPQRFNLCGVYNKTPALAGVLLYNVHMHYFDKTFFKFLFAFLLLISVSIGTIAYVRGYL